MAVADPSATLMEIASTLSQEDIPFKLRCAICNKLAINAFRLPCCDQAICENCQSSLPESCPVCAHTPISPDLCKPNKTLRTTLKAFLRTEEKKREKDKPSTPSAKPSTPAPADVAGPSAAQSSETAVEHPETNGTISSKESTTLQVPLEASAQRPDVVSGSTPNQMQADHTKAVIQNSDQVEQPNGENGDRMNSNDDSCRNQGNQMGESGGADGAVSVGQIQSQDKFQDQGQDTQQMMGQMSGQGQMFPNNIGFDMNGTGFPNMGWNGSADFSQMMPFMPNMQATGMGSFPNMMGMPGMGVDPMVTAQGMYGGSGMGMNGMNMGMNFNAGQGVYGGWNGQNTMWNGAQDKFNPNAFSNGMGGDFGPTSGYGGYNMPQHHGNFSQMHQQQYQNNDFQNGFYGQGYGRGRGRGGRGFGRGNRGRGGYGHNMQGNQANYEPSQHQLPSHYQQRENVQNQQFPSGGDSTAEYDSNAVDPEQIKKFNNELYPRGEEDREDIRDTIEDIPARRGSPSYAPQTPDEIPEAAPPQGQVKEGEKQDLVSEHSDFAPMKSVLEESPALQQEGGPEVPPASVIQSTTNSNPPAMAPPTAPLGPAAQFHAGDPYRDLSSRGRGSNRYRGGRGPVFLTNGNVFTSPTQTSAPEFLPIVPTEPKGQGVMGAPTGPKAMRERLANSSSSIRGRGFQIVGRASMSSQGRRRASEISTSDSPAKSRDESRSRSQSGHRSRHHRRHRHRSPSGPEDERERDERRKQRHRDSRRDDDDEASNHREVRQEHSRSSSPESTKKSSHREHREKERRSSHKHRSSHRSHRHRSRSRSRKGEDRHGDKESGPPADIEEEVVADGSKRSGRRSGKDRSSRNEDPDREARHRDRKRSRRDRSESPDDSEYSSRRSRRVKRDHEDEYQDEGRAIEAETPVEPEKDPHTLEREARNRERLLKEQQRREAVNADRDGKGGGRRESKQNRGSAAGRRVSYKYEDEESDNARIARIEQEREVSRW